MKSVTKIAITYCSGSGHTRKLAQLIADGASQAGETPTLYDVENLSKTDWDGINAADAIVFGAPTYMGSVAAAFKSFMDQSSDLWTDQKWANKIAAGFTVATFPSGDKLMSLQQLSVFAAQHGMIWVGQNLIGAPANKDAIGINQAGSWLGYTATSSRDKSLLIDQGDAMTAIAFGKRIAIATRRWQD